MNKLLNRFNISDLSDFINSSIDESNVTPFGLISKTILIVVIILGFIIISYFIISKFNTLKKENMEEIHPINDLNVSIEQNSNTILNTESILKNTMENKVDEKVENNLDSKTKTVYNKLEEVNLPSNLTGEDGYIGRDQICYRYKVTDRNFVNKRYGCMACQIDKRNGQNNYNNTKTNIIATCVYSDKEDPNDNSVWTKEKCISVCSNNPDYKDIE